jgi:hypothetical protein
MPSSSSEIHLDDSPMFTGTHAGADSSTNLRSERAMFRSLGVDPALGQYCENETQSTGGPVTAATDDEVTVSGVTWDYGDTFSIYKTDTKNKFISRITVDRSRGWKITKHDEVNDQGWRHEDWDIDDRGRKKVFGPGQPER